MIYFRFECDTVALINRTAYILLKPYYFIRCGLTVGIYNNQRLLMPHGSVPFGLKPHCSISHAAGIFTPASTS